MVLAQADATVVNTVWDFVLKGGVMMIPIGVCSLAVLAVVFERVIVLRRRRVVPKGFADGLARHLGKGHREPALAYCREDGSPVARVFEAALSRMDQSPERVEKHMAAEGEQQVFLLRRRLRVLSVITAIAPLLGLVGTIFGMIRAFQTVSVSGEALGKTELLAEGIYEAMITTAAGLLVAIPTLVLYHWLHAKVERLAREINALAVEFLDEYVHAPASEGYSIEIRPEACESIERAGAIGSGA